MNERGQDESLILQLELLSFQEPHSKANAAQRRGSAGG